MRSVKNKCKQVARIFALDAENEKRVTDPRLIALNSTVGPYQFYRTLTCNLTHNYYLRKAVNLFLKVSKEVDETMASGRQFQSAIVFGKNELNLKTSLFAYGT